MYTRVWLIVSQIKSSMNSPSVITATVAEAVQVKVHSAFKHLRWLHVDRVYCCKSSCELEGEEEEDQVKKKKKKKKTFARERKGEERRGRVRVSKMKRRKLMYIFPLLIMSVMMSVLGERSIFPENGYYSYHPSYYHDLPPNRPLPSKIPFGMPMGGYSAEGRGPPFGLVAFYFEVRNDHESH